MLAPLLATVVSLPVLTAPAAPALSQDPPSRAAAALVRKIDDLPYVERVERYRGVAALNRSLAEPDAKVSRALAGALVDDAYYVRELALPWLLDGQDPDELVRGLLEGLERLQDDVADTAQRLAFLGETAGRGDRGKPGFGEDDQRAIQASMLHARSLHRALALVPDRRTEKALLDSLGEGFGDQPAFMHLCALKGCLALDTARSLGAVGVFIERLEKALARDRIRPHIPRGGPWIGYGQLEIYGELRDAHLTQAIEDVEAFHATLPDEVRAVAAAAVRARDWDAWRDALEPRAQPEPATLDAPLRASWEPHADALLELMKPDWSWSRR